MSIINDFVTYVKQTWENRPSTKSPVSAERLGYMEDGIKSNSDAIEKVAAAVLSTIVNDPDKIASMAALYAVNQTVAANAAAIAELNSNTAIVEYDNFFVPGSDYTVITNNIYRVGKRVFGNFVIQKNAGYFSSEQETIGSTPSKMRGVTNTGCFMSDDTWKVKDAGYVYMSLSSVVVAYNGSQELNIAKITFDVILE